MIETRLLRLNWFSTRERRLAAADERLREAKSCFSRAALSCLRGDADATERTRAALALVDEARGELARLADVGVDALDGSDLSRLNRNP